MLTSLRVSSGRLLMLVATACAVAGTLPVFLVGALAVQIRADLEFGPSAQGLLVGCFFGGVAIGGIPLGGLADRLGWWRSLRFVARVVAVVMLMIAFGVHAWLPFAIALFVGGFAHSMGMPAGNLAILRGLPVSRRGMAFGIRQAAIPLSVLLGGLSVPLIAVRVGWRPVFLLAVIVPVTVLLLLRVLRDSPSGGPTTTVGRTRPPMSTPLAFILVLSAGGAIVVNTSSAFLVTTAVDGGFSESAAGLLLMLGSAISLVMRIASGVAVDRFGHGYHVIAVLLLAGALGFVLIATGGTLGLVVGTGIGFGAGTGWAGLLHYVATAEHPDHAGGVSGTLLTFGNIGGFLGPTMFGVIAEQWSFGVAWTVLAGVAVLAAIAVLLAGRGFEWRRSRVGSSRI